VSSASARTPNSGTTTLVPGTRFNSPHERRFVANTAESRSNGSVGRTLDAVSSPCDVVSCAGPHACKLGITSSLGLNQAVREGLIEIPLGDGLTRRIHVKMSGCANGCGSITAPTSAFTAPRSRSASTRSRRTRRRWREWPAGLTAREVEVLALAGQGHSNKEIAERLVISRKTVGNHIEHIYMKIGCSNRAQASLFAMKQGLLGELRAAKR
jgi:DNA-binding CsgD family transcriptional regulator